MATLINRRRPKVSEAPGVSNPSPIQLLIPETHQADFAEECRGQSRAAAASDAGTSELDLFIDAALADLDDDGSVRRDILGDER